MKKIDEIFPELNFGAALIITIVMGIVFQVSGSWMTMLIVGAIAALFLRSSKKAFFVGLVGVGIAWTGIFIFLVSSGQALAVGDYFLGLLGLENLGWLVIVISILVGALLGGFGGLLGRSLIEFIDALLPSSESPEEPVTEEPTAEEPASEE
ncbi:MAG: hypothetical protein RTU30_13135 [Candidatus Thorarchaeota archaeon]